MTTSLQIAGRPARILIVDDERQNRQLLELMLAPEEALLASADSGEEALRQVAQQAPDLILLDVVMPGMDGYQVVQKLKSDAATKSIPIIMITALDDRDSRIRGLSAGAEDVLGKPVDRTELSMRVRNLLRLKAYGDYYDTYSQVLEGEVSSQAAELRASERLYRSTFETAPVGIVHVGLDGHWLRVNQRVCELLGYTRQELQDAQVQTQLLHGEVATSEVEAFRQMAAGTLLRHVVDEKRYRRQDGSLVFTRVNVSVHRDADGQAQHFIVVLEDITERRNLESQLLQASKLDAVGSLASGIAHDFNNLLSIVLSYSELLASKLQPGDPMLADLGEIQGAGLRASALTRQLLAFSRQQLMQPKLVSINDTVRGMEKMLRRLLGEDVQLATSLHSGLGPILVDPGQLEQVIMNLAVNARDAMPRGGALTIQTAVVLLDDGYVAAHVGAQVGPHVMLLVSDTGEGMDSATQARLFEPFFSTKAAGKGTGLGLSTVFGIVQQSGGTIGVESATGKGSTFKVHFPMSEGTAAVQKSLPPPDLRALRGSETILLVEDEERVRVVAQTIMRKYGYKVLDAQSGGDALLLCEQHTGTIDLLLTDVVMPRMSGRQLAERLHSVRPNMKVLYMSGHTDDAVVRRGLLDATVAFLQKPITPETLARKIREVLDG
mgnify:CR=1 FL=1